ncbi:unnamed protein product [Effrenium voratum]|nr:unnamed protein product [Effrenium voratum]
MGTIHLSIQKTWDQSEKAQCQRIQDLRDIGGLLRFNNLKRDLEDRLTAAVKARIDEAVGGNKHWLSDIVIGLVKARPSACLQRQLETEDWKDLQGMLLRLLPVHPDERRRFTEAKSLEDLAEVTQRTLDKQFSDSVAKLEDGI